MASHTRHRAALCRLPGFFDLAFRHFESEIVMPRRQWRRIQLAATRTCVSTLPRPRAPISPRRFAEAAGCDPAAPAYLGGVTITALSGAPRKPAD
jgi:hypothetical protein